MPHVFPDIISSSINITIIIILYKFVQQTFLRQAPRQTFPQRAAL